MATPVAKTWSLLVSAGALLACGSLTIAPAKADPPICTNGYLIQQIIADGTYTCQLGNITYGFNGTELGEFTVGNPSAALYFTNAPLFQTISFADMSTTQNLVFSYEITSPVEEILGIEESYLPSTHSPTYSEIIPTVAFPTAPSLYPFVVANIFSPNLEINSLTYTIHKTPAPLPIAGASLAFAFQRKLRQRIRQGS